MRKVDAQMVMAVRDAINGSEKGWRCGNTSVDVRHIGIRGLPGYERNVVVRLHGHEIARFDSALSHARECRGLRITDAGWQTATTKRRLNTLLACFYKGQAIRQVRGQWLLNSTEFSGTDWVSCGWLDNWHCQQAEALCKPAVKASGSVYDVDWHRAMGETLAAAKVAAVVTALG